MTLGAMQCMSKGSALHHPEHHCITQVHHTKTLVSVSCVSVVFLVIVMLNHADVLKSTGALVHTLLFTNAVVWWLVQTINFYTDFKAS